MAAAVQMLPLERPLMMIRRTLASLLLVAATAPAMAQSTSTEMSAAAASVVVLAQKCAPSQVAQYRQAAFEHLQVLAQSLDALEQRFALESFEDKIKAITISSQDETCSSAERLRSFALHWGFSQFVR